MCKCMKVNEKLHARKMHRKLDLNGFLLNTSINFTCSDVVV